MKVCISAHHVNTSAYKILLIYKVNNKLWKISNTNILRINQLCTLLNTHSLIRNPDCILVLLKTLLINCQK